MPGARKECKMWRKLCRMQALRERACSRGMAEKVQSGFRGKQTSQKRNFRTEGSRYEHMAGAWLESHGFRILEYNFRCRSGEIDLIARKADTLVFVEVKHRTGRKAGSPLEAVDHRKQRTICRCADVYRLMKGIPGDACCRFDVVGIDGEKILHVENAFEYGY